MTRASGILMHITSLASEQGIGTLGKSAYEFVDFLQKAGQQYWQVLPLSPTSYGDSPYQSFSTFAGNPYFIDLPLLAKEGLLRPAEYEKINWGETAAAVDYEKVYLNRFAVLNLAYERFISGNNTAEYDAFCEENSFWLPDYALYMAIKGEHGNRSWQEWDKPLRHRDEQTLNYFKEKLAGKIAFYQVLQYWFFKQWTELKDYAHQKGISLIGDLPIYVALDSADVWANPQLFALDDDLCPIEVAGCPPDYFSATGQLWGNPLYNWEAMKNDGYSWWISRIRMATFLCDTLRIDHFRGFDSYYAIPAESETAQVGQWRQGPGMDFFYKVQSELNHPSIIAEDLGMITDSVRKLLRESGYPGMKVLQFAFALGQDSDYLPHKYDKNCICYTGTHDNTTLQDWISSLKKPELDYICQYTRSIPWGDDIKSYTLKQKRDACLHGVIATAWGSNANLAVTQMQDFLALPKKARMNTPSTIGENWQWRLEKGQLTNKLAAEIRTLTTIYGRLAPEPPKKT